MNPALKWIHQPSITQYRKSGKRMKELNNSHTCSSVVNSSHNSHNSSGGALISSTHAASAAGTRSTKCSYNPWHPCGRLTIFIKVKIHSFTISDIGYRGAPTTSA